MRGSGGGVRRSEGEWWGGVRGSEGEWWGEGE